MIGLSMVVPFLPLYLRELGVHGDEAVKIWSGLIFAAPFMIGAFLQPIWGVLGDRYGRTPPGRNLRHLPKRPSGGKRLRSFGGGDAGRLPGSPNDSFDQRGNHGPGFSLAEKISPFRPAPRSFGPGTPNHPPLSRNFNHFAPAGFANRASAFWYPIFLAVGAESCSSRTRKMAMRYS
jgi:hypothetical protein